MGQYFSCVCPGRAENINLPSAMKVTERLTHRKSMAILAYLLTENDDDSLEYAGRWHNTNTRLVGDYDESGLYSDPDPVVTVSPLANPHLIRRDERSTTAPNRNSVTTDETYKRTGSPMPVIKGSWKSDRCNHSHPSQSHPDPETGVGTYISMRASQYDGLEEDTYGVIMEMQSDWTDITTEAIAEFEAVNDSVEYDQDSQMKPFAVLDLD